MASNEHFEDNDFSLQVISKGSFIDEGVGNGNLYLVEATTIRLNHVALNEWLCSVCLNTRDCYADGLDGDAEWAAHKAGYAERRQHWREQIIDILGIDTNVGSVSITQSLSEVFTAVYIKAVA